MNTRAVPASAFAIGTLFGIGLGVAQMTNPEKVMAFLRWLPGWDPSLMFVMGAGVVVTFFGYRYALRCKPVFADDHAIPTSRAITPQLLGGAALFGIGWGMAGYCPGPAIAGLLGGSHEPIVFMVALLAGSEVARIMSN